MRKKKQVLTLEVLNSLKQIFNEKEWEIPEGADQHETHRFNRFCDRLCMFQMEEQKLIIELTERFEFIDGTEYLDYMMKLFDKIKNIGDSSIENAEKIFVFPLLAPEDFNRTKSSSFLWYFLNHDRVKHHPLVCTKKIIYCEKDKISWVNDLKENEFILLVDDFIGSGETAECAVKWFVEEHHIAISKIIVVAIAAQRLGISYLRNLGIKTYSYYEFCRGISDYYFEEELSKHTKMMEEIEKKLKVNDKYKFGYKKSEALISLNRTPNNTFPVFWKECEGSNNQPFGRG